MTFYAWFFAITTVILSIGFLIILFNSSARIQGLENILEIHSVHIDAQQKHISTLSRRCMDMAREIHALTYITGHPETINSILCRYEKKGVGE